VAEHARAPGPERQIAITRNQIVHLSTAQEPRPLLASTVSTTKQDYVRNADQLCSLAVQDAGKVVEETTNPIDRFEQIILVHQGLFIRWGQLAPPPSDVSKVDKILQTYNRANDQASDAAAAYRRGDNPGDDEAEAEGKRLQKQASELARAYGLRVCSQLGS
jgi:DNA repair exonuclease SbcCD ATPase subunit